MSNSILKQDLHIENDSKGTMTLTTTFDTSAACEAARRATEEGRPKDENHQLLGYIPPAMWGFDPWLLMANKARRCGDIGEYTKMVKKFFEVHPQYAVHFGKKYF